ncbi:P-loop containing nucleoside triphosphate hydrolase protein [Dacryopinax primogenitus]|uniref:p-loop containing nucleoside triphosphate hydrolase protein n=1 Tax=Dacryopinax primogenitus (strain DJM 731) TaxID=1858805 RepID=M5G9R0_DACPD|nr:P-loop containing nucleoside triphosphate hydrolase protein [Dacryopinax primogenitus]EJU00563.1 P-loop containing nucleoside triphosphate hydrolase protein [Dacryopinax primogenitus]
MRHSAPSRHRHDWRQRAYSRLFAHHEKRVIKSIESNSKEKGKSKYKEIASAIAVFSPPPRVKRLGPPIPHTSATQPLGPEIEVYKTKFDELLKYEEATCADSFKERLEMWDLDKLKEEGYVLVGLRGFWRAYKKAGKPIAVFSRVEGDIGWNRFDAGSVVTVCRRHPLYEETIPGTVVQKTTSAIHVAFNDKTLFDDQETLLEEGVWRLDFGSNNINFARMRAAIEALAHNPAEHEFAAQGGDSEYILRGTFVRDALLRSFKPLAGMETPRAVETEISGRPVPERLAESAMAELPAEPRAGEVHPILSAFDPLPNRPPSGAFTHDQLIQSWARRYRRPNPIVVEGDPVLDLNETQTRAVALMLSKRLSLVQGPPGTGKTKTIIEAARLLKLHFEVPQPLLVATYTNVAVDNLVAGLAAAGLRPLRVGGEEYSQQPKLDKHRLEVKIAAHPLQKEVEKLEKAIDKLSDRRREAIDAAKPSKNEERIERAKNTHKEHLLRLKMKKFAIRNAMIHDIVSKADVVCTTCLTSANTALNVIDFPVVFLDEASMSTEPASLIPLMKGSRHVALIGDHKQLPPIITSAEAQAGGLSKSLFERLTEEGDTPSIMLDMQYRMHPSISRFPSAQFYNKTLRDGTVDHAGKVRPSLAPPKSTLLDDESVSELQTEKERLSVVFVDHAGSEAKKDRSRINAGEAQMVCSIVEELLYCNPSMTGDDIGIIAPYVAQIRLLDRLLKHDQEQAERFKSTLGEHRGLQMSNIEVKTVDGFEGREKEVIIFSTVRNNPQGAIGFLADGRRLNVGLTRARRALFVLGNAGTLKDGHGGFRGTGGVVLAGGGERVWKRYMEWLEKEQLIRRWAGGRFLPLAVGKTAQ